MFIFLWRLFLPENKSSLLRMILVLVLSVIIIASGIVIWVNYEPDDEILTKSTAVTNWEGTVYIQGSIAQPGYYPCCGADSITELVEAAGGLTDKEKISNLILIVNDVTGETGYQKIDINRAEVWLFQALPGIGEVLAQRICDHCDRFGPFSTTTALLEVEGIGPAVFENIREFITVSDR